MKKWPRFVFFLLTLGLLSSCADGESIEGNSDFSMKATVVNVGERIEVDVYEAEYAEGIYWLVTDENTKAVNEKGKTISLSNINIGDKIEIEYNGQVMMSYPPQVYAIKIIRLK